MVALTVAERITERMESLTRTERRIAQVMLSQYPLLGLDTQARFAQAAQTSAPSVMRFLNKIGFATYPDFQDALRDELQPRLQSPLNRYALGVAGNDEDNFRYKFSETVIANIVRARELLSETQFQTIVKLLADVRRPILCLGGRHSGTLAESMYNFLAEMRPRVSIVRGQTETWPSYLLDVGKRHILIVFDFRRYQGDVSRFSQEAAERGAKIIVFTDEWMSGISRFAHHVIMAPVSVPSLYDSNLASFMQMEALVGALGLRLSKSTRKRIETLETLRDRLIIQPDSSS